MDLQKEYEDLKKMYNLTKESNESLLLENKAIKEKYSDLKEMYYEKLQESERKFEDMRLLLNS